MKDIVKRNLTQRFSSPVLRHVRYLVVDEINVRNGYKSLTLMMDLDSGAVLFVGDGKGAEYLVPQALQMLPERHKGRDSV